MIDSQNFKEYSAKKLAEKSEKTSKAELGDRSTYIGASDIGDCLRKSYCSKMYSKPELPLDKLLVYARGHIVETIVESILEGLEYIKQYEVEGSLNGFSLKAHCDYLVKIGEDELVYIECKSVSGPIDAPYSSWFYQCQYGMGLIAQSNPGKKVRAMVVAIDLNLGWMGAFDIDFDQMYFEVSLGRAAKLIDAINTGIEPEADQQLYCSKCSYKRECPGLQFGNKAELPEDVKRAVIRLKDYNSLKKEMDALKAEVKAFMESTDIRTGIAGNMTVQYRSKKGTATIDKETLEGFLNESVCFEKGTLEAFLNNSEIIDKDTLKTFLTEKSIEKSIEDFTKVGEASTYVQIV